MAHKKPRDKASEQIIESAERRRRRFSKKVQGPSSDKLKQGAPGTYKLNKEDQSSKQTAAKGKLKYKSKTKTFNVGPRKVESRTIQTPIFGDPDVDIHRTDSKQDVPGGEYKPVVDRDIYKGKEKDLEGKYKKPAKKELIGVKTSTKKLGASTNLATIAREIGTVNPDVLTKVKRKAKIDRDKGYISKGKEVVKKKTFATSPIGGNKRKVDKTSKTLSKSGEHYIRTRDTKTVTKGGKEKTVTKISRKKNPDYLTDRDRRKAQKKKKGKDTAYKQFKPKKRR